MRDIECKRYVQNEQYLVLPTSACNVQNAIYAEWSPSYLSIYVFVPDKHNKKKRKIDQIHIDDALKTNDCKTIFDAATLALLGNDAECFWMKTKNENALRGIDTDIVLVIDLASTSTINQNDNLIFIDSSNGPLKFYCVPQNTYSDVTIPSIQRPMDPFPPNIILSSSTTQIGICDDLVLDARDTTYLGGRNDAIFEWAVTHKSKKKNPTNYYYGNYVVLGNKLLSRLVLYDITLTVTNWYNETSIVSFDVFVSDQAIPKVFVTGTHVYKSTRVNLNGYVDVSSKISFDADCLSNTAPAIQYELKWSVTAQKLYNDSVVIDDGLLNKLNADLDKNWKNFDSLRLYANDYLQPGLLYLFDLNLQCIGGDYECNLTATHDMRYYYADLKCNIRANDMNLQNIDPVLDNLNALKINANGYKKTWDPDQLEGKLSTSKDHLVWNWQCNDVYTNESCSYFFKDSTRPNAKIDLGKYPQTWSYAKLYEFEFIMGVHDGDNLGRPTCYDSFSLIINTSDVGPTANPTLEPSKIPSSAPSELPTLYPSMNPSLSPSEVPSSSPTTMEPTNMPSISPSNNPSLSPSDFPTHSPTNKPSVSPTTISPTNVPSSSPTTSEPTNMPTLVPSNNPSVTPTNIPTLIPTMDPSRFPTFNPSQMPTTAAPTMPITPSPTPDGHIKFFIVQVTAINDRITTKDRAAVIGDVINWNVSSLDNVYFTWSEVNGLLNDSALDASKDMLFDNSLNLILKSGALDKEGEIYSFKLIVEQYRFPLSNSDRRRRRRLQNVNNPRIGYGESTPADILVLESPIIHESSFEIEASCVDSFYSIDDLQDTAYELTISADTDNGPLLYQFGYILDGISYYFHGGFISDSHLNNVYLPNGDFTIFGNVIDADSAISTQFIECSIVLLNDSKCVITWKMDVIDAYIDDKSDDVTFGNDEQFSYIFAQTNIYLQYLNDNHQNLTKECLEESIKQIIDTLDEFMLSMCANIEWTVHLAQTMTLMLNLINMDSLNLTNIFYADPYLDSIQHLLFLNLDPCECIRNFTDVTELYLLPDSVVTQTPSIYYLSDNNEITECLSPIIADRNLNQILFDEVVPIMDLIDDISKNKSQNLYDTTLDAVYITTLIAASTAIPNSEICTKSDNGAVDTCTVVIDQCDNEHIELIVGNTTLFVSNNTICNEEPNEIFTVSTPAVEFAVDDGINDDDESDQCWTQIVDNSIKVSMLRQGNESITNLNDEILLTFDCENNECDDSYECVSYDSNQSIWQNEDCSTVINFDLNEVECACSQLTVIGTRHKLYELCDDAFISEKSSFDMCKFWEWILWFALLCLFLYCMVACFVYDKWLDWQRKSVFVVFLIGMCAFLYCAIMIFGHLTQQKHDLSSLRTYLFFLLCPQVTLFALFTIICHQMFGYMHRIYLENINMSQFEYRLKNILIVCNLILIFFLIVFIWILAYAPSALLGLTVAWFICIIGFCICNLMLCAFYFYCYQQKSNASMEPEKSWKHPVTRLLIINILNFLFFLFLTISNIHFAADPMNHMQCDYMMPYYFLCFLFLLIFAIIYTQWLFDTLAPNDIEAKMGDMIDDKSVPLSPEEEEEGDEEVAGTIEMNETVQKEKKRPSFLAAPFIKIARRHSNDDKNKKRRSLAQMDALANSAPPSTSPDSLNAPLTKMTSGSQSAMIDTVFDQVLVDGTTTDIRSEPVSPVEPATPTITLQNNNTFVMIDYESNSKGKDEEEAEEAKRLEAEFEERELQRKKTIEAAEKERLAALKRKKEEEHKQKLEDERKRQLAAIYAEKERAKQQRLKEIEAEKEKQRRKEAEEAAEKEKQRLKEAEEAAEKEKERLRQLAQEQALLEKLQKEAELEEQQKQQQQEEDKEESEDSLIGDEEEEKEDFVEEVEPEEPEFKMSELINLDLPKPAGKILGDPSKYKKRDEKETKEINRDLRKLSVIFGGGDKKDKKMDLDEKNLTKVAVLKYYDILFETFRKYCKIGGDSDWLTIEGWDALMKDAFICDEENGPTAKECHDLFYAIYNQHHELNVAHKKKISLRQSQLMQKQHLKVSTRTFVLSEWNDDDPWTGIWEVNDNEYGTEQYTLKQIGDKKVMGFIKSFDFCDINGSLNDDKLSCKMMIFWHQGARKNKRRLCKVRLNKPQSEEEAVTITVDWKSIAISSNQDQISAEKGYFVMNKVEKDLSGKDDDAFKGVIGLARHEYFDAMCVLAQMKFAKEAFPPYHKLSNLCEKNLIPFIWGGDEGAQKATLKGIFRPFSTELHRLFEKYNENGLMSLDSWNNLCSDIFKQNKAAFAKGGKPTPNDINASYQLSKDDDGHDLELTYKLFEGALAELAQRLFKKKPKAKYNMSLKYNDKLKKLLKWCAKLEKSKEK